MPRNLTDESLTVALVDDDPLVRTYLDQLLQDAGLRVLWTAAGASEAVTTLRRSATLPDVVAIDVRMPGTDGHRLTKMLLSEFTALKVVMLTSVDDPHSMSTAIAAGALATWSRPIPRRASPSG